MSIQKVCIVGVGYVGLTLGVILADKGFQVTGFDTNKEIVGQLKQGKSHFFEKGLTAMLKKHVGKNFHVTSEIPDEKFDAFVISVGTPFDTKGEKPIVDYLINGTKQVINMLTDDALVIIRSTVPLGGTRSIVKPLLDETGKRYSLAFCPERTAEGAALRELVELPQIIGGLDNKSVEKAFSLFRKITPTIVEVESLEAAEMVKLINNSFRDLNFAFANEIALICEKLKLNPFKTIAAANLGYPRSNVPKPGLTGGTCLKKDPYILSDFAMRNGYDVKLISAGRKLNEYIPHHIANIVKEHLKNSDKTPAERKIFITGFAFKGNPENDDVRDSLTLDLVEKLKSFDFKNISGHDFVVNDNQLKELNVKPCSIEEGFNQADCVIIANNHKSYSNLDIENLVLKMNKKSLVIDCWHNFDPEIFKKNERIRWWCWY